MKLFSAYYNGGHPFDTLRGITECITVMKPEELEMPGILVLWGGEDISPAIYNKPASKFTYANNYLSRRDKVEVALARQAIQLGMPIIGVCRGGQLLCALAGGHLIQHVKHHSGSHYVRTYDGENIKVNSIHHQMMFPFNVKHEMRAWIENHRSDVHIDVCEQGKEYNNKPQVEPEYVYFPEVKGYAIQWHPEMLPIHAEANQYLLQDIQRSLNVLY